MALVLIKRSDKAVVIGSIKSGDDHVDFIQSVTDDQEIGGRKVAEWEVGVHPLSEDDAAKFMQNVSG